MLFAAESISGGAPTNPKIQKWEYAHYRPGAQDENVPWEKVEAKLNEMGDQGWELISVNAHNGSWVSSAYYIFKRAK